MTAHHRVLVGLTLIGLLATSAAAAPLLWTLSGVTFSDGGTASGSFVFNPATNTYSDINITTTTGSVRTGAVYHFRLSAAPSVSTLIVAVTASGGDLTGTPVLALQFPGAGLTNTGGTVTPLGAESVCADSGCSNGTLPQRNISGGSVVGTTAWFTSTGSLKNATYGHTATLLPDGKVLVAGGLGENTGAELYNPVTGTWTATGSMTYTRWWHTATLLPNGKVLVVGGEDSSGPLASAELYDPATGTWSVTGAMGHVRWYNTATLLVNGEVLVTGGDDGGGGGYHHGQASAEVYDPATGTWSPTGSMTVARVGHTATLLPSGQVLVAGGSDNTLPSPNYLSSAELYDPATGHWTPIGSMTYSRFRGTATTLNDGRVLLAGGAPYWFYNELYDPATGTWSPTGNMIDGRYQHTATLLANGKVLVVGGFSYIGCELYDPATGIWSSTASPATLRWYGHTATLLPDGRVLVAAGVDKNNQSTATAELYGVPVSDDTSVGSNVQVQPLDPTTGTRPATITFTTVTQPGNTTVTTSTTGQPPPNAFKLGAPPTYFDINTNAAYAGPVTVCFSYNPSSFSNPSKLHLFHNDGSGWMDVTTSVDTATHVICGTVNSLSPFGIFESKYTAVIQQPINADGTSVFRANRGVVPVKFTLWIDNAQTCQLPPATISLIRTAGGTPGGMSESVFALASDNGPNFRIDSCQYVYNLATSSLGVGSYSVSILIAGEPVGSAAIRLQ
jgi:N-acetylneuraminic acid mutarotase